MLRIYPQEIILNAEVVLCREEKANRVEESGGPRDPSERGLVCGERKGPGLRGTRV